MFLGVNLSIHHAVLRNCDVGGFETRVPYVEPGVEQWQIPRMSNLPLPMKSIAGSLQFMEMLPESIDVVEKTYEDGELGAFIRLPKISLTYSD